MLHSVNVCVGDLNVSVSAEAVQSHIACDNEIVNVPERGRIDTVTKSLLVKVCSLLLLWNLLMYRYHLVPLTENNLLSSQAEGTEKTDTYNWLLCPTGQ